MALTDKLTAIADAIRAKTGTTERMTLDGMATVISEIEVGEGQAYKTELDGLLNRSVSEVNNNRTSVSQYLYAGCETLTMVNLPYATSIEEHAFTSCKALTTVNVPLAETLGMNAFQECTSLGTIAFPLVTYVKHGCCFNCRVLTKAVFNSACTFDTQCFAYCGSLNAVVLCNEKEICTLLNVNAFGNTPIESGTGYIYVPAALIDTYKADSMWSTYAAQFRALEDYTIDGTITGELDETKIAA